jgi:hypothetical protein
MPSGVNSSVTPSVASRAWYCAPGWRGSGQDGLEVVHRQRLQLHADREAALQFGNQVAGLGQVEGAAGDEQDVVGLDHAVLGVHGGALHQRQQVALHALARHLGAALRCALVTLSISSMKTMPFCSALCSACGA